MYLVTGASGKLGRSVVNHLLTTYKVPANKIIAASRDTAKLADLAAKGVAIRKADFADTASLDAAFKDVERILLISTDAMEPGVRQKQHVAAVTAAEKAKVDHVLYTSMPTPGTSAVLFAPDHNKTETALTASTIKGWTVLRHNWYFENLLFSLPQALKSGTQYTAAAQGKIAHIARDDLAQADAAALVNAKGKKTYTLSGAQSFTTDEIAKLVSSTTGKPLNVVHVPIEGLIQGMLGAGLPEGMARVFASFDTNIAQGGLNGTADDYKALTGLEPVSFETWLKTNAKAFVS